MTDQEFNAKVVLACATLNKLRDLCHELAVEKKWHDPAPSVPEALVMWHAEISEAIDVYGKQGSGCTAVSTEYDWENLKKPTTFASEVADVLIRVLDSAGQWGLDLEREIEGKLRFNRTRPNRHGGKIL